MADEVGFAVVGLGMGKHHCRSIISGKGAKLIAICDLDEERLSKGKEDYNCRTYVSFDEMLNDPEIACVNIAVPSGMHSDMGIQAIEAGKHIIVEKPADIKPEKIDLLREAGEKKGVKIGCIFQARLDPLNIAVRDAIQGGRLGKLIGIHGHLPWYRKQSYYEGDHGSWKGTWDLDGGGSLMNQGVHTVDLIQWLGGRVSEVSGMFGVFGHEIEAEDQTVALLRFENGALGTIYTTTCCYPGYDQLITIYGTKGSIRKDASKLLAWRIQGDNEEEEEKEMLAKFVPKDKEQGISADPMAVSSDGHTQFVEDMAKAITEDRDPMIGLDSAKHAVEIITSIFEAGRTGKTVSI